MKNQGAIVVQRALIGQLVAQFEEKGAPVQIFETHISWILVSEKIAYKFKKAVHFDFLDFSTLDARHFYCQEEYRLNLRLAPNLYLGVVTITGTPERPLMDGPGTPIEYAVKMRAFPQAALWSHRIKVGSISAGEIDALAQKMAQWHLNAAIAENCFEWGAADALQLTANDNLKMIASLATGPDARQQLGDIERWQSEQQTRLHDIFASRKEGGRIKECHGDLHSGNILTINDRVEVFDCIEFNESLRWIDIINDLAFIYMDLDFQERSDLATRLLNLYLEITGDYAGLSVLRYYQVQRALVRCKVALLRARQLRADAQGAKLHESQGAQYLAFAAASVRPAPVAIMITHGFSGSGKSTFSRSVIGLLGAVQLRSDVERKRMHGRAMTSRENISPDADIYASASTLMTYRRLAELARLIIKSGRSVVVDAAFLRRQQRAPFKNLAHELGVPFFIFDVHASTAVMRARIAARAQLDQDPSDAGLLVLAHQMTQHDMLSTDELKHAIAIDSELAMDAAMIRDVADPVIRTLQAGAALPLIPDMSGKSVPVGIGLTRDAQILATASTLLPTDSDDISGAKHE